MQSTEKDSLLSRQMLTCLTDSDMVFKNSIKVWLIALVAIPNV